MKPSLLRLLKVFTPFRDLHDDVVSALSVHKLVVPRQTPLSPESGSLYVVVLGRVSEHFIHKEREAYPRDYNQGDIIGLWPSPPLVQASVTTYLQILPGWESVPELKAHQQAALQSELDRTRSKLVAMMSMSVAERLAVEPKRENESIADVARRVGASREQVSRTLQKASLNFKSNDIPVGSEA